VPEQELDLLQLSSGGMAEPGAAPPNVMRRKRLDPHTLAQSFTTYHTTFCVMPSPQTVPFLRIERKSLSPEMAALSVQVSPASLNQNWNGNGAHVPSFSNKIDDSPTFLSALDVAGLQPDNLGTS